MPMMKARLIRASQVPRRDRLSAEETARLDAMFAALDKGDERAKPSRYWVELNRMNVAQLKDNGYENFKRTLARNYFTWMMLLPWDSQICFLCAKLKLAAVARCAIRALTTKRLDYFTSLSPVLSFVSKFLGLALWEYLFTLKLPPKLLALREPMEGNPPVVEPEPGMKVSQDLANSILEYDAFRTAIPEAATILELGGGYGRNAFVVLSMHRDAKLIMVDIPPALWVAERYLSSIFPEKRVFRYRDFARFEDVAEEYARADIVFLLSTQIHLVPRDSVDLILNISFLHEMRRDQIQFYFDQFDRVMKPGGSLYTKQWRKAEVLFEGVTLEESDYPVPAHWRRTMRRIASVQTRFFEAMFTKAKAKA